MAWWSAYFGRSRKRPIRRIGVRGARWGRFGRTLLLAMRRIRLAYGHRARTFICREGFYYFLVTGFVFTGAVLGEVNLLLVLGGMLLGPLWLSWRLVTRALHGLEVHRSMPRAVCAGDLLVVKIELANTRRRSGSWAVVVEEEICRASGPRSTERFHPTVFFSYAPPGQKRERTYRARLNERGHYRFEVPVLSTRFPFGLFRRTIRTGGCDTLVVYPRLGRLTQRWLTRHRVWFEGTHRREHRHGRVSGDFYGVRPWRHGDSRRMIHWRSSARHGTLVVRQFEQHRNRDLAVLVDLWQPDRPSASDRENLELAVSFAATVVADACRRGGSELWVGTTANPLHTLRGPSSALLMQDVMDHLAVAEPAREDRLLELVDRALTAVEPGTEIVLVTTRPLDLADPERFPALAVDPARRALVQRVRIVNTSDPSLAEYFLPE